MSCRNNVVTVYVQAAKNTTGFWGTTVVGTVPSGYRPARTKCAPAVLQEKDWWPVVMSVNTMGEVSLNNQSGAAFDEAKPCYGFVSYVIGS